MGTVDLLGTNYEDDHIATGYGGYLARPLLRNEWRPDLSAEEAEALLRKCMTVLFYRDCRSINRVIFFLYFFNTPKIQFSKVTCEGVTISEPVELPTSWEFKQFLKSGH